MDNKFLEIIFGDNSVKEFNHYIHQGIPSAVFGVSESFKAFLVSSIENKVLFIVKDFLTAENYIKLITELSDKKCVFIPAKDEVLLTGKAFSKDRIYERISAIEKLENSDIIIVTPETLFQIFPKKTYSLTIEIEKDYNLLEVVAKLVKLGYQRTEAAESKGTFSVRGDVLDVFPIDEEFPVRIDFFGDTVENIKKFNLETRRNEGNLKEVKLLQTSEFTFFNDNVGEIIRKAKSELSLSLNKERYSRLNIVLSDLDMALSNGDLNGLTPLSTLSIDSGNIFEKLDNNTVICFDESKRIDELIGFYQKEFNERFETLYKAGEVFSFSKQNIYSYESVIEKIKQFKLCAVQTLTTAIPFFNPLKIVNPKVSAVANYHLDFNEFFTDVDRWVKSKYTVKIYTGNIKRAEKLCFDLSSKGIASSINNKNFTSGIDITDKKLSSGFIFHEEKIAVIGSGNLFVKNEAIKQKKTKKKGFFTAPEIGDYCVHETYGVGKVLGNKKITTAEGTKDYVAVEYYGGDILYIPVEQMDVLTRYLGSDKTPRLSKIGGSDFEKVKARVKESIRKMSFDLKRLYSERNALQGFPFRYEKELEDAFNNDFPFEETADQISADEDIKNDMLSEKVMDRLICGDVGFGKTEVAFRAAFRAIVNGKQVAMLAPTTILTEQHYNSAVERFKNFGVRIACLNRLKTGKEQKQVLDKVKNGEIDFLIGTHRMLSKDVDFKDLGLLILDEEQRFGVGHKEKIKLLKKNVDTLTLTATPIPRTLHMSLSGIRAISTINTPPKKRLPVQTYVTEQTDTLIRDAIMKEINRGGQAFILYNRVESIYKFSEYVRSLIPDIKMTVTHGQMDERAMESGITQFYRGETDLLISTTIIENGIDLPRANTIIVIDADYMGLSTLYQLKGRVGRSDRLAYAYFTFKREKVLSGPAFERLNAIIEFAEMGSGIKIAMRDLEIRGAGNILGAEQHGHMDKIGYELYSKLLKEELTGEEEKIPELDVRVSAFIPESYMGSSSSRMDAYKGIAEITNKSAEQDFRISTEEVFGALPNEVENLINIAVVKRKAGKLGVSLITITKDESYVTFESFKAFSNNKLMTAVDEFKERVKLSMTTEPKLQFVSRGMSNEEMLKFMRNFFEFATEK